MSNPSDEAWLRCGREACHNSADPRCWNSITGLFYCPKCADLIGREYFPMRNFVIRGQIGAYGTSVRIRRHQSAHLDVLCRCDDCKVVEKNVPGSRHNENNCFGRWVEIEST